MKQLRISPELALPIDAVTQRLGFLGTVGSGKSYAATKLAELMLDAGGQIVAIDPVGIWYGLRLAADGTKPVEVPDPGLRRSAWRELRWFTTLRATDQADLNAVAPNHGGNR